jgi:hypothetical protein
VPTTFQVKVEVPPPVVNVAGLADKVGRGVPPVVVTVTSVVAVTEPAPFVAVSV